MLSVSLFRGALGDRHVGPLLTLYSGEHGIGLEFH